MIYKVFSDNDNFNEVEFTKGINIVLGVKNQTSNDNDTMNGVGKTTLLEIIDFCLGSQANKDSYLKNIKHIENWTFSIILDLFNSKYTVSRSINDSSKIYIDGNFENLPSVPEEDDKGHFFKLNEWRRLLGLYFFDLKDITSDYPPTFRSLISYFIRKRSESYLTPFEHHSKQQNVDVQVNNAFLLGLNWKCSSNFQVLKNDIKNVKKALKEFDDSSIGEMETKKINLENEVTLKEKRLSSFKIHENYNEIENHVNQLSEELTYLSNKNMVLKRKLEKYYESISNEVPPNNELLENLYSEIEGMFNLKTKKTLEEVRSFHNDLIENRKSFLNVEILEVKKEIEENGRIIEEKGIERSKLMNILNSHNALDEFRFLQEEIYDEKIKLNDIKRYIDKFNQIKKDEKDLELKRSILKEKIEREYEVRRPSWEKSILIFDENTKFLYDSSGDLIINRKEAYTFDINFPKNDSRGISKMKIFCYDLMLIEKNSSEKNIDFLIHDSEIFTDVDSRQVAKAFQLAKNKCEKNDLQYIFTMNSDELEKIKLELPNDFDAEKYIRLRLFDNIPQKHLLGTVFN